MLSAVINAPDLAITQKEAGQLNDAIKEVVKYHPVAFDPAKVAVFNLCVVAGGIYLPRLIAMARRPRTRRAQETEQFAEPAPAAPVNGEAAKVVVPSQMWPQNAKIPDFKI